MKIKYYKITKFNVVFNLKRMEKGARGPRNEKVRENIKKKHFG